MSVQVLHISGSQGHRNAVFQINFDMEHPQPVGWTKVVARTDLGDDTKFIRIDAVYHMISDGLEVQLAWKAGDKYFPFLPCAGRGRVDFSEVTGVHSKQYAGFDGIAIKVSGVPKNDDPIGLLILDLSKHQGAQ